MPLCINIKYVSNTISKPKQFRMSKLGRSSGTYRKQNRERETICAFGIIWFDIAYSEEEEEEERKNQSTN